MLTQAVPAFHLLDREIVLVVGLLFVLHTLATLVLLSNAFRRRKMEQALRQSEARARALVQHIPQRIFFKDKDLVYVTCNASYARDLGLTPQGIVGKVDDDLHPPELAEKYRADDRRVLESGPIDLEEHYVREGQPMIVRTVKTPVRDEAGDIMGLLGIFWDVTEQVQAKEALSKSQERLLRVIEHMPVMMDAYDAEGNILVWNRECERVTGYSAEEMIGNPESLAWLYPDADYRQRMMEEMARRNFEFRDWEWQITCKDGHVRTVAWSNVSPQVPIPGWDTWAIGVDVTERVQAQEALRRAEWEKEIILDSQLEHVIYQDCAHRILWANRAACESVGMRREELTGRFCYHIWPQSETRCKDCPVALAMETGRPQKVRKVTPDGRAWYIRGYSVRDENEQIVGGIEVTQEITEQVRAQEEIQRLNAELEQRVLERTAELQAVNEELEAFAYSVSHDLRAPLRAIDGFSQALLEDYGDCLNREGQSYLERVRAASQHMGQLIEDLLQLSRLTRSEMQRERVDLSALAQEILGTLSVAEPEREMEMIVAPGIMVKGDARLLRVALENLLSNAFKFTSKQPRARIAFGQTQVDEKPVYFVRDNGVGFDMAYADKLFGAFQRLHRISEFEGTGIGLVTVHRIIQRHGGRVWAEAAVGQGATFYFTGSLVVRVVTPIYGGVV